MLEIATIKEKFLFIYDTRHGSDRPLHDRIESLLARTFPFFNEMNGYNKDPSLLLKIRNNIKLGFVVLQEVVGKETVAILFQEEKEAFISALVYIGGLICNPEVMGALQTDDQRYAYLYANFLYRLTEECFPSDIERRAEYRLNIVTKQEIKPEIKSDVLEYLYNWNDVKVRIQ